MSDLRALAEAATKGWDVPRLVDLYNASELSLDGCRYVQAIDPTTLLALLDERDALRERLRGLIEAIETTGLHEHDDDHGGVDLCLPISGIRAAVNDACDAAGHEFLHPEGVPPFCRWCGAALASARAGAGEGA